MDSPSPEEKKHVLSSRQSHPGSNEAPATQSSGLLSPLQAQAHSEYPAIHPKNDIKVDENFKEYQENIQKLTQSRENQTIGELSSFGKVQKKPMDFSSFSLKDQPQSPGIEEEGFPFLSPESKKLSPNETTSTQSNKMMFLPSSGISPLNFTEIEFDQHFFTDQEPSKESDSRRGDNSESVSLCSKKIVKRTKKEASYNVLSLKQKMMVLKDAQAFGVTEAAKRNGVKIKNVNRWIKFGPQRRSGGGRKTLDPVMESKLEKWVKEFVKRSKYFPGRRQIAEKAKEWSMFSSSFKASKGWCDKFLKRNRLLELKFDCYRNQERIGTDKREEQRESGQDPLNDSEVFLSC